MNKAKKIIDFIKEEWIAFSIMVVCFLAILTIGYIQGYFLFSLIFAIFCSLIGFIRLR